ncbi:uncharacterized protein LOC108330460 [Vigna angularis]|uniref:uncharacterized protein LOC108330460 n=1 Tax=Phaseolus angularis TaxID=3914 RepID=UPI00080A275B|nr:uncharacterized protein LOC108330460 [Vigna angularis]
MADIPPASFPVLTDKNWNRWSAQMKVLFHYQGVSAIVEERGCEPDLGGIEEQKEELRRKDDKALFIIHQCVDDVHFEKIQNAATTREAWGCGETTTNLMLIEKIMRSLPQKCDHIVVAIEESRDLEKLKVEELQSSLEAHEMRMSERNPIKLNEQALKVQHSKRKGKWKKESSSAEEPDERSDSVEKKNPEKSSKKKDGRNIECFNCHKFGHFAYECFSGKGKKKNKFQSKEAHLAQEESDSKPLILMAMTTTEGMKSFDKGWYLDSGCSNHMTCNRE